HVQGPRVNRVRLRQALQLTQSTSPNYLLLASLDAARQQMATAGRELMARTLAIAQQVRSGVSQMPGLTVLSPQHLPGVDHDFQLDPTRLVVDFTTLGISGFSADEYLHQQQQVTAELPTLRQLAFILSVGNQPADGDRLVAALAALTSLPANPPEADLHVPGQPLEPTIPAISQPPMTPRAAFFATAVAIPLHQAIGEMAADAFCPYPPGIPLLLPGERITAAAIASLQHIHQAGGVITGNPDPTWQTIRVIPQD
ncbi:MAG: arginine decarboxylase, partial [Cyanobacteria bacterium P01_H01_bin.152]